MVYSPKTISEFWFVHMSEHKKLLNVILVKYKAALYVSKAVLSGLKLFQLINARPQNVKHVLKYIFLKNFR